MLGVGDTILEHYRNITSIMNERGSQQYRFRIDVFSVESLPMSRLAEYMAELARLLGEHERVHFSHLEPGSAVLVSNIEEPAAPKVTERIAKVRDGRGPKDAMTAFRNLDNMLAKDNAVGTLAASESAQIIEFPGRMRPKPVKYGPFRERGSLDGIVIRIGGRDDTVPVLIQDSEAEFHCQTSREVSKRLAQHYLGAPVRVHGNGKWVREENGSWQLLEFYIEDFEVLDDSSLLDVVGKLRKVEGSTWHESDNSVASILGLRHNSKDQH